MASAATSAPAFFTIQLAQLASSTVLGFDLYLQHDDGDPVLYRAASMPFTEAVRQRLLGNGVVELLVPREQQAAFEQYVTRHGPDAGDRERRLTHLSEDEENLAEIVGDVDLPVDERCRVVLGVSREIMAAAFADLTSPGLRERVHRLAELTVRLLLEEPRSYAAAVRLFGTDFDTFEHGVHTAFYTIALARGVGIDDPDRLAALGRAALLHDVGRGELAGARLHQDESLSDLEWAEVMSHPERGAALLESAGWDDPIALDVCRHHHERCDGSGYPMGWSAERISLPSRMVAIADTFDALTCHFPGRPALTGFQALWTMRRERAGQFDPELLDRFVEIMIDPQQA